MLKKIPVDTIVVNSDPMFEELIQSNFLPSEVRTIHFNNPMGVIGQIDEIKFNHLDKIVIGDKNEGKFGELIRFVTQTAPNLRIIRFKSFWKHNGFHFCDQDLDSLATHNKQLKRMDFGESKQISESAILNFIQSCPLLEAVNFSQTPITNDALEAVVEHTKHLRATFFPAAVSSPRSVDTENSGQT